MLQAPKAPDISDIERFSLIQVNNLLQLADRLMDPGIQYLYKLGCHEPAFDFLLDELKNYLQYHPTQFEVVLQQASRAVRQIQSTPQLSCEMDHVWVRLIKYVFTNGNILDLNDIRMSCCRAIYLTQLRKLLEESLTESISASTHKKLFNFDKLNRPDAQMFFFELIGQLLKLGFESNARAIHNFLYLAKKVAKSPSSGMSVDKIATTIAPCMLKMLFADKTLGPIESAELDTPQSKKELQFMSVLVVCLLRTNRFDAPFSPDPYRDYIQAGYEGLYQNVIPTVIEPFRLVDFTEHFKKLQMKDKSPFQLPAPPSPDMRAALVMKKDEPVVRAASFDKLLSRVPRSHQLKQHINEVLEIQNALVFSNVAAASSASAATAVVTQVDLPENPEKKSSIQLQ